MAPDPDAEPGPAGGRGLRYNEYAHDRVVLADPLVHPDRTQPSLQRHGVHHRGATGFPGSTGSRSRTDSSEILVKHGYNTYAVGKWHLTPADEISAAGPSTLAAGAGLRRFYGFLGGDTSQYYPDLVYDNHQVSRPGTRRRATT